MLQQQEENAVREIEVVAAIILHEDKVLCAQRGNGKFDYISNKFEFPGGKVERGESREEAIVREIKEELRLDIVDPIFFMTVNHKYPDFKIKMHSFLIKTSHKNIVLIEHVNVKWLDVAELDELVWAEADIPIVEKLLLENI